MPMAVPGLKYNQRSRVWLAVHTRETSHLHTLKIPYSGCSLRKAESSSVARDRSLQVILGSLTSNGDAYLHTWLMGRNA
jgi:hypothetical protein